MILSWTSRMLVNPNLVSSATVSYPPSFCFHLTKKYSAHSTGRGFSLLSTSWARINTMSRPFYYLSKEGKIDDASLEAKFFRHGGVRAVTALAAAGADDNNILSQLEGLEDEELGFFLKCIDTIKWHPDLEFMAEVTDRKRPSITTKKTYLVRPRASAEYEEGQCGQANKPEKFEAFLPSCSSDRAKCRRAIQHRDSRPYTLLRPISILSWESGGCETNFSGRMSFWRRNHGWNARL